MKAILLKEIKSFFGSPIGYLVIAVFLIISGLYLWVFEGDYNILNSGFADMGPFFTIAPLVFLFLIPAVTMRSFSDEIRQGTLELLYVAILYLYGAPTGNIDFGSTMGSYFGLMFVIATYASIGIFTSTLSENQIIAFVFSVFLCFLCYFAFDGLSSYFPGFENMISSFGMNNHFKSMSRGVIDTRDILYFISITFAFLSFTVFKLKSMRN
jgi:ABC-2 type transport system permease protein